MRFLIAALAWGASLAACSQPAAQGWSFVVTPYVWLPNVDGTLKYPPPPAGGAPDVAVGPNDYLENLDLALMLAGEARQGRWSIVADAVYLDFGAEKSDVRSVNFGGSVVGTSVSGSAQSSLKGLQISLAVGYSLAQKASLTLDLLGGFRYLGVEATTSWQLSAAVGGPGPGQTFPAAGSLSRRADLWDAIVGVRGRARPGEGRWFVPYHLDIGAGSSSLTWQALLGVGYAFTWGDALLAYRHLAYDQSDDRFFQDFRFSGPALGASFRF